LQFRSWNQKKKKNPIKKGEFFSKPCSESFVIDGQAPCKKQQKQQNGQEKKKTRTYHQALKLAREHCDRQLWQQQQQPA
jgi:hypothetical protein